MNELSLVLMFLLPIWRLMEDWNLMRIIKSRAIA